MAEPQNGDTRIRRVITAIDENGNAFSESHGEEFFNGRWRPDDAPKSLANAGPEADSWKAQYSGAIEAERDALKLERDAAQKALTDAESTHAATVATMQAEIDRLTALLPPQPINGVPQVISRTQARLALYRAGMLPGIDAAIAAGSDELKIWYEAAEWHRTSLVLVSFATSIGMTSDQVDTLFVDAGAIVT